MSNGESLPEKSALRPLRKIVFFLQLPEPIAIANGSTFNIPFDEIVPELHDVPMQPLAHIPPLPGRSSGQMFVSYRFWQVDIQQTVMMTEALDPVIRQALPPHFYPRPREKTEQDIPQFSLRRTVIEAVTPIFTLSPDTAALTEAFDRCLAGLNELQAAYQVATRTSLPRVNRHRLPFIVLYTTADLIGTGGWDDHLSPFQLHTNTPVVVPRNPLNDEEMEHFTGVLRRKRNGDPLMLSMERAAKAHRALHVDGDYATAVIEAEIAFEIFIDGLLTLMLWEEQITPEEAATLFEDGLATRVRNQYHPRLGGNWNTKGKGAIAAWAMKLASLRGRVVHAGYIPPFEEAKQAVETLSSTDRFVKGRLIEKRSQYMKTALFIVGKPGLEQLGIYNGQIRRLAENRQEPDWLISYRQWRERFVAARQAL